MKDENIFKKKEFTATKLVTKVNKITREDLKKAYREKWKAENRYKGLASAYKKMELKFLGYKEEIDEEFKNNTFPK